MAEITGHTVNDRYKSCIKIHGIRILPPVINDELRITLQKYKHQAIQIEKRLSLSKTTLKPIESSSTDDEHYYNDSDSSARSDSIACSSDENNTTFRSQYSENYRSDVLNMLNDTATRTVPMPSLDLTAIDTVPSASDNDVTATNELPFQEIRSRFNHCLSLTLENISNNNYDEQQHSGKADDNNITNLMDCFLDCDEGKPNGQIGLQKSYENQMFSDAILVEDLTTNRDSLPEEEPSILSTSCNNSTTEPPPHLCRSDSFILDNPSPLLLAQIEREKQELNNPVPRKSWDLKHAKQNWSSIEQDLHQSYQRIFNSLPTSKAPSPTSKMFKSNEFLTKSTTKPRITSAPATTKNGSTPPPRTMKTKRTVLSPTPKTGLSNMAKAIEDKSKKVASNTNKKTENISKNDTKIAREISTTSGSDYDTNRTPPKFKNRTRNSSLIESTPKANKYRTDSTRHTTQSKPLKNPQQPTITSSNSPGINSISPSGTPKLVKPSTPKTRGFRSSPPQQSPKSKKPIVTTTTPMTTPKRTRTAPGPTVVSKYSPSNQTQKLSVYIEKVYNPNHSTTTTTQKKSVSTTTTTHTIKLNDNNNVDNMMLTTTKCPSSSDANNLNANKSNSNRCKRTIDTHLSVSKTDIDSRLNPTTTTTNETTSKSITPHERMCEIIDRIQSEQSKQMSDLITRQKEEQENLMKMFADQRALISSTIEQYRDVPAESPEYPYKSTDIDILKQSENLLLECKKVLKTDYMTEVSGRSSSQTICRHTSVNSSPDDTLENLTEFSPDQEIEPYYQMVLYKKAIAEDSSETGVMTSYNRGSVITEIEKNVIVYDRRREPSPVTRRQLFPTHKQIWAATIICAGVRGYLTRRLVKTERVQILKQTFQDSIQLAVGLHNENPDDIKQPDMELHTRLVQQLHSAACTIHDIFFNLSLREKLSIISLDRHRLKEKMLRPQSARSTTSITSTTQRVLERKLQKSQEPKTRVRPSSNRSSYSPNDSRNSTTKSNATSVFVSAKKTSPPNELMHRAMNFGASKKPWR